jgi:hypothetical protein
MSYAKGTKVSAEKTQMEIRKVLSKYKATGFAFGEQNSIAVIMFEMNNRRIRFNLPLAAWGTFRERHGYIASQSQVEQENRRLWRCLLICIKSKLESVESNIGTFEEEFLAHIVLPNGKTMGEVAIPQIAQSYTDRKMPPLLGYSS